MDIKERFLDYLMDNGVITEYMAAVKENGYEFDEMYAKMESKNHLQKLITGVFCILDGDTAKKDLNFNWLGILNNEFDYNIFEAKGVDVTINGQSIGTMKEEDFQSIRHLKPCKEEEEEVNELTEEEFKKSRYTFEDLEANNGEGGLFFKATGVVIEIVDLMDPNKAFTVKFIHPFTGQIECEWRGNGEIKMSTISEDEWVLTTGIYEELEGDDSNMLKGREN